MAVGEHHTIAHTHDGSAGADLVPLPVHKCMVLAASGDLFISSSSSATKIPARPPIMWGMGALAQPRGEQLQLYVEDAAGTTLISYVET